MEAIEEHMDVSQSEEWSGTLNELWALVRAKFAKNTVVRVNGNPSLFVRSLSTIGWRKPTLGFFIIQPKSKLTYDSSFWC